MLKSFKKVTCAFLCALLLLSAYLPSAYAFDSGNSTEQLPLSVALENPEIVSFLKETGEINHIYQEQTETRNSIYSEIASYANESLDIGTVTEERVAQLVEKYDLQLPGESASGIIDDMTLYIERNTKGNIIDVWALQYSVTGSSFTVRATMIDADNPLDKISGEITLYQMSGTSWNKKTTKSFSKTNVRNGVIYTWSVKKWAVKEKFEYDITVTDNGLTEQFDNKNENNYYRYNFVAGAFDDITPNGGERHHFVSQSALSENGYSTKTAYSIRMMTADHRNTGSYGNQNYVKQESALLKNRQYEDLLQKEVNDFKAKRDCDGIERNLQLKYHMEIITCLVEYEKLFGIA